ncbi:MAG: hypothetical protein ACERLM_02595 [Acidimicrobiales bacterium]
MSNLEKIQSAEVQLDQVQDALSVVQQGLEHAESVAVVAAKAKARTSQVLKVGLVLGLVALVLVVLSRWRSAKMAEGEAATNPPATP